MFSQRITCSPASRPILPRSSASTRCMCLVQDTFGPWMLTNNSSFQVSHQFAMGERLNPYAFAALYGSEKVCEMDANMAGNGYSALSKQGT